MDFIENILNYIKIKGPKVWMKNKLNKMRCRKSWVAYLFKTYVQCV